MFKKSLAFGLLAAGLMIAPTAAFAGQYQGNQQSVEQNGAASDGSTNAQSAQNISNQVQSQIRRASSGYHPNGYRYHGYCSSGSSSQNQNSSQGITQNGAASNGSTNAQDGSNHSNQVQVARSGRHC